MTKGQDSAAGAGPYTCTRCLAGTWNDDDLCDRCQEEAQPDAATGAGDVEKRVEYFADYGGQPPRELMREVLSSLAAARQENERLRAALEWLRDEPEWWDTPREFRDLADAALSPAPKEPSHDD